ncbi:MAG: enoyl-CoA hydratase-related protein [Myxococcota bacterium]
MEPSESESLVRQEIRDGIAVWTLDRPNRRNALSRGTLERLIELRSKLPISVRAVVLTGAGDKAFCAGADLKERKEMSEEEVRSLLDLFRSTLHEVDRMPIPTIAAIDGVALGGGFELAMACDFRIIRRTASVGLPEVSLAIIPGAGGTVRLTRLVGEARAKELILLSKRLTAEEAYGLGLAHRIHDTSALEGAMDLAQDLARKAPIAVSAALEAIDGAVCRPQDDALDRERRCYERTLSSQDRIEALSAFVEKRPPRFLGE